MRVALYDTEEEDLVERDMVDLFEVGSDYFYLENMAGEQMKFDLDKFNVNGVYDQYDMRDELRAFLERADERGYTLEGY